MGLLVLKTADEAAQKRHRCIKLANPRWRTLHSGVEKIKGALCGAPLIHRSITDEIVNSSIISMRRICGNIFISPIRG